MCHQFMPFMLEHHTCIALLLENGQVLRSRAREVDKLEERMILRESGGRRFHKEGPMTVKDLDLSKSLSNERRGRRDVAEKGDLVEPRRYLGATHSWVLRLWRWAVYSKRAEIGSQ